MAETPLTEGARAAMGRMSPVSHFGAVESANDIAIRVEDRLAVLEVGARVDVETGVGTLAAEVVGLGRGAAVCLPFGSLAGVRRGARVAFDSATSAARPSRRWLGRVFDGLGRPVDGKGAVRPGSERRPLRAAPPPAALRNRLGPPVEFGVKALDVFCPARVGQRLGVFSGSGIGKSTLLAMIARNTACDVAVIALIGERGREVREFIEDHLGPDGLARAVVIVATSDEPAMMRREAAFLALTVGEYFRDQGANVLCLMDSLTRVAAAQREIGLAAGEPPTAKGYTPSVFSLLPKLLERAGPGVDAGAVTGIFTVLVEGDDHEEPIADAARAILDGHVVLDRRIAERGRFPAVDILRSVSRAAANLPDTDLTRAARRARQFESTFEEMREMIRIGAYQPGASEEVDRAIAFHGKLESFLAQAADAVSVRSESESALRAILAEVESDG
jgi:flagellum-specific ATP synthase